jgi:hypothetical protein
LEIMTWSSVHYPLVIAVIGDGSTFMGSLLLAWDVLWPEKDVQDIKRVMAVRTAPPLAKLTIDMNGRNIATPDDVKLVFMLRRARKAKVGAVLLAIGFAALLTVRLIEAWK